MAQEKEKLPVGYKYGKLRAFYTSVPAPAIVEKSRFARVDHFFIFLLLSLAMAIRLYKIPSPPKVVFDEVHFGGFAKEYYDGLFFVDVHPPLAKLAYFWITQLFGWDGKFEFAEIGDTFDVNVPYIQMRLFSGICGVLTVLCAYGTLRASNCRPTVSFFGAYLVLIENSLVTQSRFILLDAPMIFGLSLAVLGFKRFQIQTPFTAKWWKFLIVTGVGLGITTSVKLTGLFTVAWVGLFTLYQLWRLWGDLEVSPITFAKHFFARVFGLIVVPLTIYLGLFALHFIYLPLNGSGSGAMSPKFKSTLLDSDDIVNSPAEISYGSTVTIKHNNLESYLHSHNYFYQTGTKNQQVSLYGFSPDGNNEWIIETKNKNREGELQRKFRPVKDGDIIRLYHIHTGKYLKAHDARPPISEHDYSKEVSCNGTREDFPGDNNYEWKVRIVGKKGHAVNDLPYIKLRTSESIFQLVNRGSRCSLMSHTDKLPDWGFNQNEVLCVDEPTIPNTLWYIETNSHPVLNEDVEKYPKVKFGKVSFWSKFLEYHKAMIRINKTFTEDHSYSSTPETWPFLLRGVNYFSNSELELLLTDETGSNVYFLGNVAIYYISLLVLVSVSFKVCFYVLRNLNPYRVPDDSLAVTTYYDNSIEYIAGWVLHYLPFFHMSRQLFLHHYLGALYFSILLIAQYTEYQFTKRRALGVVLLVGIGGLATYCFVTFAPLIYGYKWDIGQCLAAKWFPNWDFDCIAYTR